MAVALIKPALHTSIAEGLYEEIVSRSSRYYHFVGAVVEWIDESDPPEPKNSIIYERDVRRNIIYVKEIKPNEISFVIRRIDWAANTVYDDYDDAYSSGVIGVDLISGGNNYSNVSVSLTANVNNPTGTGATANATVVTGSITDIVVVTDGYNFNTKPTVTITGTTGTGACATSVLKLTQASQPDLENGNFYVLTDDYNVYKCIDNNNGALSTQKPTSTSSDTFQLSDGYVWKFMYNIPVGLRNKFLTLNYMPVVNATLVPFYSNGEIKRLSITSPGSGYTSGAITLIGDGYLEDDPLFLTSVTVVDGGSGWEANTVANIAPPFTGTVVWTASANVSTGDKIYHNYNIYEVVKGGTTDSFGPTHTGQTALNGTAGLKFIGTQVQGNVNITGNSNTISSVSLSGSVKSITLTSGGSGYTKPPSVSIAAGITSNATAYATLNGNSINRIYINEIGSGYFSTPNVVIGTEWTPNTILNVGDQIFYSNRVYTVSSSNVSITLNTLSNVTLTTVGENYYANVRSNTFANVVTAGAIQPASNASVVPIYTANYLTGFYVSNVGSGYSTAIINNTTLVITTNGNAQPTVNAAGNLNFVSATTSNSNGVIGITGSIAPVHSSGTVLNGTANLTYAGTVATATATLKYGAGYSTAPTISFSGVGSNANATVNALKSEAILEPIFQSGQLVDYEIVDGGIGYTYATLTVTGDGTSAKVVPVFSAGDLSTLNATNELLAKEGAIDKIVMISGGYGYTSATVEIKGTGSGANAIANITGGRITDIYLDAQGSGYTYAKVKITGNGKGANARAVLPPPGGHGKDPIKELFANSIMMVTNITDDLNQGFNVNNDYRQFGIIKDIRGYNQDSFYSKSSGSACWVASGNVNTSLFTPDLIVQRALDDSQYIVVASDTEALLLQSIEDEELVTGQGLRDPGGNLLIISDIGYPEIDKYSGSILFIDNRKAFLPIDSQIVTLRTILKF